MSGSNLVGEALRGEHALFSALSKAVFQHAKPNAKGFKFRLGFANMCEEKQPWYLFPGPMDSWGQGEKQMSLIAKSKCCSTQIIKWRVDILRANIWDTPPKMAALTYRINILDKMLAGGGYFERFRSWDRKEEN